MPSGDLTREGHFLGCSQDQIDRAREADTEKRGAVWFTVLRTYGVAELPNTATPQHRTDVETAEYDRAELIGADTT